MRAARQTLIALAALSTCLPSGAAFAANLLKTPSGAAVHWEDASITLGIDGENKSAGLPNRSVVLSLAEAARAWNGLPEMKVHFALPVAETAAATTMVSVRFCKGNWRYRAGLLANTEFTAAVGNGVVTRATIIVNECDYKFVGPEEVAEGHFDLQAVLTHELGHVLGLAHTDDLAAVMFENTGSVRQRRPVADDRAGIAAIYDPDFKLAPAVAAGDPGMGKTAAPGAGPAVKKPGRPGADPVVGDLPVGQDLPWPDAPAATKPRLDARTGKAVGKEPSRLPGSAAVAQGSRARQAPPADVINAVRLEGKDRNGQTLMLYTIEPTLLPAIEAAREKPAGGGKPRGKVARSQAAK